MQLNFNIQDLIKNFSFRKNKFTDFDDLLWHQQDVLLFNSTEAAQEIAFMLGGQWDGCNAILVDKCDELAVNTAASLVQAKWCYSGGSVPLLIRLSVDELMRHYAAGNRNFINANLRCAVLSSRCLSGVNLSWAKLNLTNLSEANLSGADLTAADLSEANLSGANLSQTYLVRANLTKVNLWKANLRGADLNKACLSDANLSEADLTGVNLSLADLRGADLSGANLTDATLKNTDLTRAII